MVEDATHFVIGVQGVSEDNPIVKAYINLCRKDDEFSGRTRFIYLNAVNEFAISLYEGEGEQSEIKILIYPGQNNTFHIDRLIEDSVNWDYRVADENTLEEEILRAYGLVRVHGRKISE